MSKPLVIDLCCGLGGWSHGFLAEGYDCIGFDIERHQYGEKRYPGQLVLQDVLTLDGRQFKDAAVIVASPPCQAYSYMAQPWGRAKREVRWQRWQRDSPFGDRLEGLRALFDACFRIAREAGVPLVVENVKGAQPWVGRAAWHAGPYYLWGDVPALMPFGTWQKGEGSGRSWFYQNGGNARSASSKSAERKEWTATVATIPIDLASYIARCFKPISSDAYPPRNATSESLRKPLQSGGLSMCPTRPIAP